MSKGKLGLTLSSIAVIAFILSFFGFTEILVLVTGYALIVEADNWLTKQTLQALYLRFAVITISTLFSWIFSSIISFFSWINTGFAVKIFSTVQLLFNGGLNILVLALCLLAIFKVMKNNDANLPIFSQLASKSLNAFESKKANQQESAQSWICSCGNSNTNNFCSKCGAKKP